MSFRAGWASVLLAALTLAPAYADQPADTAPEVPRAAPAEPVARKGTGGWRFRVQPQFRVIPKGLDVRLEAAWRSPMWRDRSGLLFDGTYIEVGPIARLSPASLHPGVAVKTVPIAPLELEASVWQLRYFGNFGSLFEYESVDADWSPEQRDRASSEGLGRHETGWAMSFKAVLRLKLGPVVWLTDFIHHWMSAPDVMEGHAWYESSSDLLLAREDHVQTINSNLGYLLWGHPSADEFLLLGVRWEGWRSLESAQERQMLSLLTMWRPGWLHEQHFTVGLLTGVYIDDPYRTGLPYIAGFFQFNWLDDAAR